MYSCCLDWKMKREWVRRESSAERTVALAQHLPHLHASLPLCTALPSNPKSGRKRRSGREWTEVSIPSEHISRPHGWPHGSQLHPGTRFFKPKKNWLTCALTKHSHRNLRTTLNVLLPAHAGSWNLLKYFAAHQQPFTALDPSGSWVCTAC